MAEEDWTIVSKTIGNKWDEEDDDDLKENWDDEEEEDSKSSSNTAPANENEAPKPTAKVGVKKKKALKEKLMQKELESQLPKTAEELLADKLEKQRLVEESDLDLAKDTFGTSSSSDASVLNGIRLNTREDFEDFKKALESKLSSYVRSPHYFPFLEELIRDLAIELDTSNIKKLNATLNAVFNEKMNKQKQAKPKKIKKNTEIRLERDGDYTYDQFDYDDFL